MIRLLFLLLIIFNLTSYGQDTLAVVDTKPRSTFEAFPVGDSVFVRTYFDPSQTGFRGSNGSWYAGKQSIGEVDLSAIGHLPIIGIKRSGTQTTFYALQQGRKSFVITVFGSNDGSAPKELAKIEVDGITLGGLDRGSNYTICSWVRKTGTVSLHEFHKEHVTRKDIKVPVEFKWVKENEVALMGPGGGESIGMPMSKVKFFLQGDTFASVVDDTFEEYMEGRTFFTTNVFRKNLVTGAEDIDMFMSTEQYAFKSYLQNNLLYRMTVGKDNARLAVHDLDLGKVAYERDVSLLNNGPWYDRLEAKHEINPSKAVSFGGAIITDLSNIGLTVDDGEPTIVTIGAFANKDPGYLPVPIPLPIGTFWLPVMTQAGRFSMIYTYLSGSPQTKFDVVRPHSGDNIKMKIDDFEIMNLANRHLDHRAYLWGKNYWIAVYSVMGSSSYTLVKFTRD